MGFGIRGGGGKGCLRIAMSDGVVFERSSLVHKGGVWLIMIGTCNLDDNDDDILLLKNTYNMSY